MAKLRISQANMALAAVASIAPGEVGNADLANMAAATVKGRAEGAGTGQPTDLTAAQMQAILDDGWGYIGFSGTVPATGLLRIPHNSVILKVKDSGGTDRDFLVFGDSTDEVSFGLRNVSNRYWISLQTGGFAFFAGSSNFLSFNNTQVELKRNDLRFQNDLAAPKVFVQDKTSGSAVAFTVASGGTSAASGASGDLIVETGAPGSGGASGLGYLRATRNGGTKDVAVVWDTSGSAPRVKLYGGTPIAQQTDVGAAPTDTVANLAAWCETLRTRVRNIGVTA